MHARSTVLPTASSAACQSGIHPSDLRQPQFMHAEPIYDSRVYVPKKEAKMNVCNATSITPSAVAMTANLRSMRSHATRILPLARMGNSTRRGSWYNAWKTHRTAAATSCHAPSPPISKFCHPPGYKAASRAVEDPTPLHSIS